MSMIIALYTIARFSTGRRLFVIAQVLELARELGNVRLIARAEQALAFDRETREKESEWRRVRGNRSRARGNAVEIDRQLDRVIGAMHSSLHAVLVALDPRSAHAAKVRAFIDRYFPEGADAITNAEFEDALAIIEEMNEDFALLSEAERAELSITFHVPELARLAPQLSTELNKPTGGIRFATVSAARLEGHENLCTLASTIVAEYPGRKPENVEACTKLLTPIFDANARVAERRKRKNGPDVDVDPDTGEELEPGAPVAGGPAGPVEDGNS